MFQFLITIFTGIIIAAVSAWITVHLALRKFRSEHWWEKKVEAYSKVIEALHNSKSFSDKHLDANYAGRNISEDSSKELGARAISAQLEIDKMIDIAAFMLSEEANERLKAFKKEIDSFSDCPNWIEYLEYDWKATDSCLNDLIRIAKKDLQAK
jgi:predicted CopG family antitoxin